MGNSSFNYVYVSITWPFRFEIKVSISLSFFLRRWCTNADQMFKCDFNDLFTQILLQFIAKEVRDICTFMHTILILMVACCQKVGIKSICLKCYSKLYAHCPILKGLRQLFWCNTKQEIVFFSERQKLVEPKYLSTPKY